MLEDFERVTTHEIIEKNALLYIAGYVAHRFRDEYDYLGVPTKTLPDLPNNDWLLFLSRGNCIYPSASFQKAAEIMNEEFENFHGNFFSAENKIFDKLTDIVIAKVNEFPHKVIACLVRTRTYIRLRKINRDIVADNFNKKREKKIYKLCNKQSKQ